MATLTELRFLSPGLRCAAPLPWVQIKKGSNAVSVALSRRRYSGRTLPAIESSCVITPTANRNSYRVASLVGELTQGSGLCPQPWAVKSQLLQSCCCLVVGNP